MEITSIVFFDGVCNLCNCSVNLLMKMDKNEKLKFASLQSDFAKQTLQPFQQQLKNTDSIVFWCNGKIFTEADAVIEIVKTIGGFWKIVALVLQIIPKFLRNAVYRFVAKHRYQFFGKRNACRVLNKKEIERFIA